GVAGRVADVLALDPRPGRRGDDLAGLRLDVAETDLLVLARIGEVGVIAAGDLSQRLPGLDRDLAVGFRGEIENDFGGVDVGFDAGPSVRRAAIVHHMIDAAKALDLVLGVPADALAAVAELVGERPERREA